MTKLNPTYWNTRYEEGNTGWDLKTISPPLKNYIDQLALKDLKILIPGGGYSHEAQYLWEQGFQNIYVLDFAEIALSDLKKRVPDFPKEHLIQDNFFSHKNQYDLILEQTFFCALNPSLRSKYVQHMYDLLAEGGKLVGLLFDFPLTEKGPPYGGSKEEYKDLLKKYFDILTMETAYNSIEKRRGVELFVNCKKSDAIPTV